MLYISIYCDIKVVAKLTFQSKCLCAYFLIGDQSCSKIASIGTKGCSDVFITDNSIIGMDHLLVPADLINVLV